MTPGSTVLALEERSCRRIIENISLRFIPPNNGFRLIRDHRQLDRRRRTEALINRTSRLLSLTDCGQKVPHVLNTGVRLGGVLFTLCILPHWDNNPATVCYEDGGLSAEEEDDAKIAQAVVSYIASIVEATGPLALFLAPAAGLAIQAALEAVIPRYASGGIVQGASGVDNVPALLTAGEFVMRKDVAEQFYPFLMALNNGGISNNPSSISFDPLKKEISSLNLHYSVPFMKIVSGSLVP